jgi:Spy/CpxP family protein refolding chaperone
MFGTPERCKIMSILTPQQEYCMTTRIIPIRRLVATLTLAAASAFSMAAHAMPGGHGMGGGPIMGGLLPRMLERVNATPEQRAEIKRILDANAAERRMQREAGRALREQAMALFTQPTVDANAVEALRLQQVAMHDAASQRMTASMLEISRVLTVDQRKQMADYMAQRREMMQRHQRERQGIDAPKS